MDLNKLDIPLVMAFGVSDGPFYVIVNSEETIALSKEEISKLSDQDWVKTIELDRRIANRRWRDRG